MVTDTTNKTIELNLLLPQINLAPIQPTEKPTLKHETRKITDSKTLSHSATLPHPGNQTISHTQVHAKPTMLTHIGAQEPQKNKGIVIKERNK